MAERVREGKYRVGVLESRRRRHPDAEVGVVKGEVINESRGLWKHHDFVKKSKWYVYEKREYLADYADRSGTFSLRIPTIVSEHGSKSDAISSIGRI